jgi:hypothetical protein
MGWGCRSRAPTAFKAICERALDHITDLRVDIEMAVAEAGLGQGNAGLARIDALLERFRGSDRPLVHGLLHEARAVIARMGGRVEEYDLSLALVEHWFRRTGTPALIAKCERLAELRTGPTSATRAQGAGASSSATTGADTGRLELRLGRCKRPCGAVATSCDGDPTNAPPSVRIALAWRRGADRDLPVGRLSLDELEKVSTAACP